MEKMQARDIDKALDGFTRAVQLDPENGEAWNNIACLYVFLTFCSSTSFFLQSFSLFYPIHKFMCILLLMHFTYNAGI